MAETPFAGRRLHFMGAGGIGVSALMELARARGARVSGCDRAETGQVAHLRRQGFPVTVGHSPAHAEECDELIHSAAVPETHPEVARARALGRPVNARMQMLGRLVRGLRVIGVTGAHGKTTTTWMIAHVLRRAGRDPTVLVGGVAPPLGGNFHAGRGLGAERAGALAPHPECVLEVDESDNRLAAVTPTIPVVTNIDNDHLDRYGSVDAIAAAMTAYLASARDSEDHLAALVGCGDDGRVQDALTAAFGQSGLPLLDYGLKDGRSFRAEQLMLEPLHSRFDAAGPFGRWRGLELPMPGAHNVLNALAAVAVAWRLDVPEDTVRAALATCERVERRFQIKGTAGGVRVVDDYGHHPAEVAATLRAACRSAQGRVGVLFQPHRYTRTGLLMEEFAECFAGFPAAVVFLLPVYAASEPPVPGVEHSALAEKIRARGHPSVEVLPDQAAAVSRLREWARPGDTILVQGAGDVTKVADELAQLFRAREC